MSIYPDRKNGKLTGRYRIEVQLGGKRVRRSASSIQEAKALEKALLRTVERTGELPGAVEAKPNPTPNVVTLQDASKRIRGMLWAGQETEGESLRKLDRIIKLIGPDTSLDLFDTNSVDTVVTSLKTKGVADSTVNRYLSTISAFLTYCKRRDWRKAPVPEMDWRDEDEGRIRWITYEEERTLMDLLPAPYSTIVFIAIRTGLRASELLGLKPDQVEPRWVHLWKTKNGGSRSVPLNAELYSLLAPLVAEGLPDYWKLRVQWDKARKEMKLLDDPTFVFHACRHTYATRAVQAGVNIRVLQKLMGHRTIQTTLRYAHVDDQTLSDVGLKALEFHQERGISAGDMGLFSSPPCTEGSIKNRTKRPFPMFGVHPTVDCKSVYAGSIPARASTASGVFEQDLPEND